MTFLFYFTIVCFIIVCVFLILLILIQKGRGGGLASAFGGAGGNTAFGSKTGDVLTWATSIVFGIFILLAVALNLMADHRQARLEPNPVPSPVAPISEVPPPEGIPAPAATPAPAAPVESAAPNAPLERPAPATPAAPATPVEPAAKP